MAERTLFKGEARFEVRKIPAGPRKSVYRVYDKVRASYPVHTRDYGTVKQDLPSETAAQAECDRLNEDLT